MLFELGTLRSASTPYGDAPRQSESALWTSLMMTIKNLPRSHTVVVEIDNRTQFEKRHCSSLRLTNRRKTTMKAKGKRKSEYPHKMHSISLRIFQILLSTCLD